MNVVARFMVSRICWRSCSVALPGAAGAVARATASAAAIVLLRARLNIRNLRKETALVTSRIVHDFCRGIENHRGTARPIVCRPLRNGRVIRIAGACEREPCVAHLRRQPLRVLASAHFVSHEDEVVEAERNVEAMMSTPSSTVDWGSPVELVHPGAIRRFGLCGTSLRLDHLTAPRA